MNNKIMKKVCTKCLDANKQLQLNADFFVEVQYGVCDCCGDRGVVIPFERFFNGNTKLTPHTVKNEVSVQEIKPEVAVSYDEDIFHLRERANLAEEAIGILNKEKEEHIKLIRELQNKISYLESVTQHEVSVESSVPAVPSKSKQPKNSKVGEDAAYE